MWDDWQEAFNGTKIENARLGGYHRSFNKASTRNWGTSESPAPTLGLEKDPESQCIGCAFEIPDHRAEEVKLKLREREGPSFELKEVHVQLPGEDTVSAIVSVNDMSASTYIGDVPLEKRARMVRVANGRDGSGHEYVCNVREHLVDMGIEDPYVEAFWEMVRSSNEATEK